jgi:hypothetical protein
MPTGLEQRGCSSQRAAGVHEVHRVGTPAFGIPVEPSGVGGLGVLNPSLLLHGAHRGTPVLAATDSVGQGLLRRGRVFGWDFRGLVGSRALSGYPPRGPVLAYGNKSRANLFNL